jgi:hypothetical protein
MDLTDQYLTKGEDWDVQCDENSISSKTYQKQYVYRGFGNMTSW